jgi:hypothetical protein
MRVFWNDSGKGPAPDGAEPADLERAKALWRDAVRGVEDNFLGLIDDDGRTIQFYVDEGIPESTDDASQLAIVDMDLPIPERRGSYVARVRLGDVEALIEKAFRVGADPRQFIVEFQPW